MFYSTTRIIPLFLVTIFIMVVSTILWKFTIKTELSRNTDLHDLTTMSELIEEDNYEQSNLDQVPRILKTLFGTQYQSEKSESVIDNVLGESETLDFNDFDLSNRSITHFKRIGEKFYYIESSEKLDWYGALLKCESMQSRLVSLENKKEWSAIRENLQLNGNYWVDINNILSDEVFINEASGQRARYINFNPEDTNCLSYSEKCIELQGSNDHYMNPADCLKQNYFLCEMDNESYELNDGIIN